MILEQLSLFGPDRDMDTIPIGTDVTIITDPEPIQTIVISDATHEKYRKEASPPLMVDREWDKNMMGAASHGFPRYSLRRLV